MKHPFEALAIRYVHDPRNEEFLNIGVVLVCRATRFVGVRFLSHWSRISSAFDGCELPLLRRVARAFDYVSSDWMAGAEQLSLDPSAWSIGAFTKQVLVQDDGFIRFSPVVTGVSADPEKTLRELFQLYAGSHDEPSIRESRNDADVWRTFSPQLPQHVARKLTTRTLRAKHYDLSFDHAWQNGRWNVAQPVSFDLLDGRQIKEKAAAWSGKIITLQPNEQETSVHLLVGMPGESDPAREAANDAIAILRENLREHALIYTEGEADKLARKMRQDIELHDAE